MQKHRKIIFIVSPGPKSKGDNVPLTPPGCAAHAFDRYLLYWRAVGLLSNGMDRQTDGQTHATCIDPVPHSKLAVANKLVSMRTLS